MNMEVLDNVKVSTQWCKNTIKMDLDDCKKLSSISYPNLGISDIDDIVLLEALRIYKGYLIRRNKREGY